MIGTVLVVLALLFPVVLLLVVLAMERVERGLRTAPTVDPSSKPSR